ncbi:NAD(P)H-hydrate dehydratase [Kingella negevensis]|uniref:NAD(P)H-hydrate dehydratase n=1 Tax=Kingella negevensis TaxID=1522312 RepID=UPI00050A10C7|nr:NAD(P)H-hydrate dehydratase [Kingella negevensis]MDK4688596.1 NAD(P)H-hydrate dehydratase [Kingella negevensis]WII91660.1 NAD(P)H-hydrate dehydratase [Kingella negevensis]
MFNTVPPRVADYVAYAKANFPFLLQARPDDCHKGTFGTVGVLGGSEGMAGAALLAGTAALFSGCGKSIVAFNQAHLPMAVYPTRPELILDIAAHAVKRTDITTWAIGCGLGQTELAARALHALWNSTHPQLVLDADALHLLIEYPQFFPHTKRADLVLTPHPGEAAHLLNISVNQVQSNRAWAAREIAVRYRCWVVLKGHNTVISSARGFMHENTSGNAGLATAGSGDVLAGVIASFLAQGIEAEKAIPAAVWLHGAAAEILVAAQVGPIGLLANELNDAIRWLRNRLVAGM